MSTPPRLWAMIGPHPVRPATPGARGLHRPAATALNAVDFGRALDAALRGDADFFLQAGPPNQRPALRVGAMIHSVLSPIGADWDGLVRLFEAGDPVEISLGLERIVGALTGSAPQAPVPTVGLGARLAASLREDPELTEAAPAQILTYAALEAYLFRGATAAAKRELDKIRDLIVAATGGQVQAVNQDEDLGTGLKVWEGWLGIRMLNQVFGPFVLDEQFTGDGAPRMAALCHAAFVITGMVTGTGPQSELLASTARIEEIARAQGRPEDVRRVQTLKVALSPAEKPLPIAEPPTASVPTAKGLSTSWRREFDQIPRATGPVRTIEAVIEDLAGLVERYDLLINGDDSGLVFEIAPMLQSSLHNRYAELKQHPRLIAALEGMKTGAPTAMRQIEALQSLLMRAQAIDHAYETLRAALGLGELPLGYRTDASPPAPKAPAPMVLAHPDLAAAVAVVEQALTRPEVAAWNHIERAHESKRAAWRFRRPDAPRLSFSVSIELESQDALRMFVSHGNDGRTPAGIKRGTSIDVHRAGLLVGPGVTEKVAALLGAIFSHERADELD